MVCHNRLCQLWHLATYVKGLGLEDLEGCERAFSKSNALAASLRYASIFHRKQAISTYFEHNDTFEVYQNLSKLYHNPAICASFNINLLATFLLNNYKQALDILDNGPCALEQAMNDLNISDKKVFENWLEEEKVYLKGLRKEPEETLQMEYWQKLVNLQGSEYMVFVNNEPRELTYLLYCRKDLAAASNIWATATPASLSNGQKDSTRKIETARRHALENHEKALQAVHALELKLKITERWQPESAEWQNAGKLVAMRKYQQALDVLEGLIVARMFELTKMNRSQMGKLLSFCNGAVLTIKLLLGYALRKHIGKALQTRSSAIRTVLDRYNTAAQALNPPPQTLHWKEVVEYAFLADFDLLRDAHQDISQRPWATPAGRLAMDLHFKICCAAEEIERLNVEIPRVTTYIRDEDRYLRVCEEQVHIFNPQLAYQIRLHHMEHGRFNSHHAHCLKAISELRGFSSTIILGESIDTSIGASASTLNIKAPDTMAIDEPQLPHIQQGQGMVQDDTQEDLEAEEDEEDSTEQISRALYDVLRISDD
jgi:Kyakuja-Dileera-Zisupton transposase